MILQKLELTNFRQFRGRNKLRFSRGKRNVTVIFGENGRGKTGIYRAIMFCLYGIRKLSQDGEDLSEKDLHLVNSDAVTENRDTSTPAEGAVELVLTHDKHEYKIRRAISAIWHDDKQVEEESGVCLTVKGPDGNSKVYESEQEIETELRKVLDPRVREYFLFDGERIEHLTRASKQHRNEVSKGVRSLLNIDGLNMAIKAMQIVFREYGKNLEKNATGSFGKTVRKLNERIERRGDISEELEKITDEISHAEAEKEQLDKQMKKFEGVSRLIEKRLALEKSRDDYDSELTTQRARVADRIRETAAFLCNVPINAAYQQVEERRTRGEIPSKIRAELIESLIEDCKCICGRPIDSHEESPERKSLSEWLKRVGDSTRNDFALGLWKDLGIIRSKEETIRSTVGAALTDYTTVRNSRQKAQEQIDAVTEKIGEDEREDVSHLAKQQKKIAKDIVELTARRQRLEEELEALEEQIRDLEREKSRQEKEQGRQSAIQKRYTFAKDTLEALRSVQAEFTHEARELIADQASTYLREFLDEESKALFDSVRVGEDYSLQVLDRHKNLHLANISAGQRQLLSIAFITALAKVAAGGNLLEMPLFMDTPFGRLSLEHRHSLIDNIPNLCAQWVLLSTDTELRRSEAQRLQDTGRWGAFYQLKASGTGETTIEEVTPEAAIGLLRHSTEKKGQNR